jgi:hypothetical protein
LGATFFGYTLNEMLYKMSFAQLLAMIETRNDREMRAHEEAERNAGERDGGGPPPRSAKDFTKPDNLPNVSDIAAVFGGMGMS